ncbi:hypothetical protein P9272_03575 [Mesorhizobium sp. WSM4976]|uniref:hypothetical protein n=1 Tax=Mesorhizobium sp. WSM4976 TaxID=3038549 RepID=UPI002417E560|nr:hypothetical protein [Mesorhizobium sp. WSM4976]MDG4892670.1 hypothetical protein [Mesorhizobium sp. WSM4976]
MRRTLGASAAVLVVLGGCADPKLSKVRAINTDRVGEVIEQAKYQLGVYTAYQRYRYPVVIRRSRSKVCGNGLIGMDVETAKLELVTTNEKTVGGGIAVAGLSAGGAVLGAGVSGSRVTTDSQTLTFTGDVLLSSQAIDYRQGMLERAPIAQALANLWQATLVEGDKPSDVCLRLKSGDGNSYKISLNVVDDGKGNISLQLAPSTLTANGELKSTTGNTITVTFAPHDFSKPFKKRPQRAAAGDPNDANIFGGKSKSASQ